MDTLVLSQKKDTLDSNSTPRAGANNAFCRMENTSKSTLQTNYGQPLKIETSKEKLGIDSSKKKVSLNWITALAFVKFDIDQGNVIEAIYPSDAFSKSEQKTISLLSFPDSNSFSAEGALKFIFRMKRDVISADTGFSSVYGYAYFKQQRDPSNPRGFSQKSLVILSVLPFTGFFKDILDVLGGLYFENVNSISCEEFLKDNYHIIMNEWSKPQPEIQHTLNLHGRHLFVSIPLNIYESKYVDVQDKIQIDKSPQPIDPNSNCEESPDKEASFLGDTDEIETKESSDSPVEEQGQTLSHLLYGVNLHEKGCFQDINLYKIFRGNKLPVLWKLWELVLTNQPLMIMSDLPSECSEAVLGLLSVICPLEYQTDYKPYFTIFDPEYRDFQDLYEKKMAKCAIVGITNPLFLKTLPNYPNILHLEKDYLKNKKNKSSSKKDSLLETTQKLYTMADPNLKHMLLPVDNEETDVINNVLVRKSLQNLTESFLSVFKVYFKLQINDIKKFEEKDFMKFVELQKFPFKGQYASQAHILKLYSKFLKSSNFTHYLKTFPNVYIVKSV